MDKKRANRYFGTAEFIFLVFLSVLIATSTQHTRANSHPAAGTPVVATATGTPDPRLPHVVTEVGAYTVPPTPVSITATQSDTATLESPLPNPFPATDTMTDTIATVVAALDDLPQPALPPADVFLVGDAPAPRSFTATEALPARIIYLYYLPLVQRRLDPQPAPEPTPTATATATPTRTPTPTPRPEPRPDPADVSVTIWPSPSIRVARNGLLAYEIRLRNYGDGDASSVRVRLPYNRSQFTIVNSRLDRDSGDWVSAIGRDRITVTFGRLDDGERRTGTIYLRVKDNLPDNTVISMRADFVWSDGRSGGEGASNWAPVLVGGGNDSAPWVWMIVDPVKGAAGTIHHFYTDRFIPKEGIITWLNTPDGVKSLDLRTTADAYGRVWLDFSSKGRPAGTYQLVVYGARSNLTAVGTFIVQ